MTDRNRARILAETDLEICGTVLQIFLDINATYKKLGMQTPKWFKEAGDVVYNHYCSEVDVIMYGESDT